MYDFNEPAQDPNFVQRDPEGYLADLPEWSEAKALEIAKTEGITMTVEHWQIVRFLRDHYRENGASCSATEIIHDIETRFDFNDGRRHLYQLFPGGPLVQGSRIAGLPMPAYGVDPHFGSVH